MKIRPTTPVTFHEKRGVYVPGKGQEMQWQSVGLLYGEWRGTHSGTRLGNGDQVMAAQALGVNEFATFRTFFHPDIYKALQGSQVLIAKNADETVIKNGAPDKSNPNAFELWGGIDNVAEENQFMEFKVKRYEGK